MESRHFFAHADNLAVPSRVEASEHNNGPEMVYHILVCIVFTVAAVFSIFVLSADHVRSHARKTLMWALRLVAFAFAYVFIGIIYIPLVVIDRATSPGPGARQPLKQTTNYRTRSDSDVSELDLGPCLYSLEGGHGPGFFDEFAEMP